ARRSEPPRGADAPLDGDGRVVRRFEPPAAVPPGALDSPSDGRTEHRRARALSSCSLHDRAKRPRGPRGARLHGEPKGPQGQAVLSDGGSAGEREGQAMSRSILSLPGPRPMHQVSIGTTYLLSLLVSPFTEPASAE